MSFDFEQRLDAARRASGSTKWNKYPPEVLPMWVADMDFTSPPAVIEALQRRVEHGVFGYAHLPPPELVDTVLSWLQNSYGWTVEAEWLVWLPGLVCGLNVCCRAVGEPGDQVLTAVPVYYHLFRAPGNVGREAVTVPLVRDGKHGWTLDFDRLQAAVTGRTRLLMLCNPHNPVGRVYRPAELRALAEFCERNDLLLCSDEIHCQLILDRDRVHTPIAALDAAVAARTVTLMAPSKTYNIPGLGCAFAIIPDAALRRRFQTARAGIVPQVNVLGYAAMLAAYRDGGDWLAQLLEVLRANRDRVYAAVAKLPGVGLSPVEATYLAWLDLRDCGHENPAALLERAGVGLSDGAQYGSPGFLRLNFGCPRSLLDEALARIETALSAG